MRTITGKLGSVVICAMLVLCATFGPGRAETLATGARLSLHPGFTRLTVDLSAPAHVDAFQLEMARQVVIRLPALDWRLPPRIDSALGAISGFSAQPAGLGAWRLVIDVNRAVTLRKAVVVPGNSAANYQLVVELADPDLPAPDGIQPTVGELVAPANPFLPHWLNEPRLIVIDPGHGGRDPGATGITGAVEKDIVLAAALALRDALESYGDYKVVLTRHDDSFVTLSDRVTFAASLNAGLFVSVHADAYHSTAARGVSVYSLSSSESDRQASALSHAEGRQDLLADVGYGDQDGTVGDILLDMMMDVTTVDSAQLAAVIVDEVGQFTRLLDNSHRLAGYHVLKMPHTPAILIELGYLSNALDATDLQDPTHRQMLAVAIARGIHRFMEESGGAASPPALLDSAATQTP